MTTTKKNVERAQKENNVEFQAFDHIEFYVGNAYHTAHFYRTIFGFTPVAYAGLETGERNHMSFLMEQGNIKLVLTAAISPDSPIAYHVHLHGDSIKDVALRVNDAAGAFRLAVACGAKPIMPPTVIEGRSGRIIKATIAAFGHTVHSFIQRDEPERFLFPHFQPFTKQLPVNTTGLTEIDHVAISVEREQLGKWVDFYKNVLGFHQSHQEDIKTTRSGMNSKVVQNATGSIKFPIMEPASGQHKSQIEEYLTFNKGPGVQHIALISDNILKTIRLLRDNGIEFLRIPDVYYTMLEDRIGKINEEISALHELNILVDRDKWGYLMQIFTKPMQCRPTLFFEVIQRMGARGFGGGNIQALYMALEREQSIRGNI